MNCKNQILEKYSSKILKHILCNKNLKNWNCMKMCILILSYDILMDMEWVQNEFGNLGVNSGTIILNIFIFHNAYMNNHF